MREIGGAMKVTLGNLEEARRNPVAYKQKLLAAEKPFIRTGYNALLQATILQYHRENLTPDQARERMTHKYHQRFTTPKGLEEITQSFGAYLDECAAQNNLATITHQRLRLQLPEDIAASFEVTGKLPRLDTTSDGYAAWLFSKSHAEWQQELRMPLIQAAVAADLGVDVDEVTVGVYCFDDGRHTAYQFNEADIASATAELRGLLLQLA